MKLTILFCMILPALASLGQDPIVVANKCYDEKNYECATGKYKEALAEKKYQDKDYSTIQFRVGYGLSEARKYEEARTALLESIRSKPTNGDAHWTIGYCHYSLGDYEEAADSYGKAIEIFKDDTASLKSLHYWRANSYSGMGEYEEAIDELEMAIDIDPKNDNYYSVLGTAYYNLYRYEEAIENLKTAIRISDKDKVATGARYYWIGKSYAETSKYDEAISAYNQALTYNPNSKTAIWGIAAVYFNQTKWKEAVNYYTKSIALYVDDTASLKSLYYWRGRTYSSQKDYSKALSDYDLALKIDPNYKNVHWQKASVYYAQKKYKEAIATYTSTINYYKDEKTSLDDLLYFRGACYLQLKDSVNAEKDFRESIKLNSTLRDPNVAMGSISFARGKYFEAKNYYGTGIEGFKADSSELSRLYFRKGFSNLALGDTYLYTAKDDLMKSIKYDSLNKEAHRYLADAYYRQANFIQAESELDKCIKLFKSNVDSLSRMYLYRGVARWQQKEYKDAFADYEQGDKVKTFTNTEDIKGMGQLAFEIKEYVKAQKIFTRLLSLYKPTQTSELLFAYFGRGRAHLELKTKESAIKDLEKALSFSPGNKDIEPWLVKARAL